MLLGKKEVLKLSKTHKQVCCCSVGNDCQRVEGEVQHWNQCGLERFLSQSRSGLGWKGPERSPVSNPPSHSFLFHVWVTSSNFRCLINPGQRPCAVCTLLSGWSRIHGNTWGNFTPLKNLAMKFGALQVPQSPQNVARHLGSPSLPSADWLLSGRGRKL